MALDGFVKALLEGHVLTHRLQVSNIIEGERPERTDCMNVSDASKGDPARTHRLVII